MITDGGTTPAVTGQSLLLVSRVAGICNTAQEQRLGSNSGRSSRGKADDGRRGGADRGRIGSGNVISDGSMDAGRPRTSTSAMRRMAMAHRSSPAGTEIVYDAAAGAASAGCGSILRGPSASHRHDQTSGSAAAAPCFGNEAAVGVEEDCDGGRRHDFGDGPGGVSCRIDTEQPAEYHLYNSVEASPGLQINFEVDWCEGNVNLLNSRQRLCM